MSKITRKARGIAITLRHKRRTKTAKLKQLFATIKSDSEKVVILTKAGRINPHLTASEIKALFEKA